MTNNQKFKNERNTVTTKTVLQYSINRIFNRLNKENYNQKNNIELFCKTVDCPEIEIINDAIKSLPEYSIVPSVYESETETERYLKQLKEQLLNSMSFKIEFKKFDTNEKEIKVNTTTFKGGLNRVYLEILSDKDSLESHEYEIYKGESKEPYAIIQSLSPFKLIVNSTGQCNSTDVTFTQEHEFNKFDDLLEKLDYLIKENQNSSTHKINNIRILKVREILEQIGDKIEELKDTGVDSYVIADRIETELKKSNNKEYCISVSGWDIEYYLEKKRKLNEISLRNSKKCC